MLSGVSYIHTFSSVWLESELKENLECQLYVLDSQTLKEIDLLIKKKDAIGLHL